MQRKKPLRRSTPLRRSGITRTPEQRPAVPRAKTPTPKGVTHTGTARGRGNAQPRKRPPTMGSQEARCREIVSRRSGGLCEICGEPGRLEKAHRRARSQLGAWEASNILDLCRLCHSRDHANPKDAYAGGWHLRNGEDPRETPVLIRHGSRNGWALLDDEGGIRWVE